MKLTPMFEQYLGIKEEYPDALLFYRMGDFYELFFEDAEIAARELQIALTCRNPNQEAKVPMCGVPHHAVEAYLTQLLEKQYKIAICDQIEDPKEAKGLVKRAVTRVLTPGTAVEEANLEAKEANYLAALFWNQQSGSGGVAWVDFSTGSWSGLQSRQETELWQWAQKMAPRELLLAENQPPPKFFSRAEARINTLPFRMYFDYSAAKKNVLEAQAVADLSVLDLEDKKELTQALGALCAYLKQTQKRELAHLGTFKPLNLNRHCILDEMTERNLELFRQLDGKTGKGTLWHVLDQTETPMGGRLLRERIRYPWREAAPISQTADMASLFFSRDGLRQRLRAQLHDIYDMERLSTRIFLQRSSPKDFIALRRSLDSLPGLHALLEQASNEADPVPQALEQVLRNWDNLEEFRDLLDRSLKDSPPPTITEGGLFKTGFDPALDELIELSEHGESRLQELLASEQSAHNLPKLKLGFNKVFGYYFELSKAVGAEPPDHFIRRQTLVASERYTTERLKELEERLVSAMDKRKDLEYKLFLELRQNLAQARPRFIYMSGVIAGVDYWQCLAETARQRDWTRPELGTGTDIHITAGRHPVVEAVQGASDFIANDLHMDDERRILLITGPNMAGKSTVLRQAALITLLAQMGSFVPAAKAEIGLADRIFSRVGASDNLAMGQSTFMVEMTEAARILRQAGNRSLVILDEIGRGTSTFDGLALAWAVVEDLARKGSGGIRTLFATHYHELTVLEGRIPGVRNYTIAVKEWGGEIVFLRRLVPGPSDRSYGIEVARLAGVPRPVVTRAKAILAELEKKANNADYRLGMKKAAQSLLPGFSYTGDQEEEPAAAQPGSGHALLAALTTLDLDRLTPVDALNILHRWKSEWGEETA